MQPITIFEISTPVHATCQLDDTGIVMLNIDGQEQVGEVQTPTPVMAGHLCPACQEKRRIIPDWTGCKQRLLVGYVQVFPQYNIVQFRGVEG